MVTISRCESLPADIEMLRSESEALGFRFLSRLAAEWRDGTNRFSQRGEVFLTARADEMLVGVAGLNRDPYADSDRIGRVRHVYVRASHRKQGIGTALLKEILAVARQHFDELRLRTDSAEAARFYERFGFTAATEPTCTHRYTV